MTRILANAIFDDEGHPFGIVLFQEGEWQHPIIILSVQEADNLAVEIRKEIMAKTMNDEERLETVRDILHELSEGAEGDPTKTTFHLDPEPIEILNRTDKMLGVMVPKRVFEVMQALKKFEDKVREEAIRIYVDEGGEL